MKKLLLLVLISVICTSRGTAQEKYTSLLWEISGNGLKKKSYLYGTMHVSSKIAFQLSDAFFKGIEDADMIALESNPENWIEDFNQLGVMQQISSFLPNYGNQGGYYNAIFEKSELNREVLQYLFNYRNQMIDRILYRFQPGTENYSEKTYLDMYIFQSAKKNKKPVYALENFKESYLLSLKGSVPDDDDSFDRGSINGRDMEEFYVSRNLDKLDSLIENGFSKNYKKYMLGQRNENMVVAMDSLMNKGSLFAGVGAAHLPGEKGMIELLRKEGYTVKAIPYNASDKGRKKFKDWNEKVLELPTKKIVSDDKTYELECIDNFHASTESYFLSKTGSWLNDQYVTDYANGGFYTVSRLGTFPLFEKNIDFSSLNFLDSLLYLVVPGEIKKKKQISSGGYNGYEITTELANNQYMMIKAFVTPVELIIFKVGGSKNYIKSKMAKKYISSIALTPNRTIDFINQNKALDFSCNLLGTQFVLPTEKGKNQDISAYSYNKKTDSYYFVRSALKHDDNYVEEDQFEVKYFVEKLAQSFEVDVQNIEIDSSSIAPYKKALFEITTEDNIILKGFITKKGLRYYLLFTNADYNNAKDFFSSFQFKKGAYEFKYRSTIDSNFFFMADIPTSDYDDEAFEQLQKNVQKVQKRMRNRFGQDYSYHGEDKERGVTNPYTKEYISLNYYSRNKYSWESADSYYNEILDKTEYYFGVKNESSKKYVQVHVTDSSVNDSVKNYRYFVTRKGTENIIDGSFWIYKNKFYEALLIRDKNEPSPFFERFCSSFTPFDTIYKPFPNNGLDSVYIHDLTSRDSTLEVHTLGLLYSFVPKDTAFIIDELKKVIENHQFLNKNVERKARLLDRLAGLMEPKEYLNYINSTISNSEDNKLKEEATLDLIQNITTEESYKAFAHQIEVDPLTVLLMESDWSYSLYDSLELSKTLIKPLLTINKDFPDTRKNYLWLYNQALDSNWVDQSIFEEYQPNLLVSALQNVRKILLDERDVKESSTDEEWKENISVSFNQEYYGSDENPITELKEEISFLIHWYDEEKVKQLFGKIKDIEDENIQFHLYLALKQKGISPINDHFITEKWKTPKGKYETIRYFANNLESDPNGILDTLKIDLLDYLNSYADSYESYSYYIDEKAEDSVAFVKSFDVKNLVDTTTVYIFESWKKEELKNIIYFENIPESIVDYNDIIIENKSIYQYNSEPEQREVLLKAIEDSYRHSDRLRVESINYRYGY